MRENDVQMLDNCILKFRIHNSASDRVRIVLDKKENLLNADFWPKGINFHHG